MINERDSDTAGLARRVLCVVSMQNLNNLDLEHVIGGSDPATQAPQPAQPDIRDIVCRYLGAEASRLHDGSPASDRRWARAAECWNRPLDTDP